MAAPKPYRDFVVRFGGLQPRNGAASFLVWVESAPGGAMSIEDAASGSFDPTDFWEDPRTLAGGRAGRLESPRVEERHLRDLGTRLADLALPPGPVRDLFERSLTAVQARGEGLRLRLRIDSLPLSHLPWEYLALPPGPGGGVMRDFLALREEVSIVRTPAVVEMAHALPDRSQARIIGLLSRAPDDDLDLDKDRRALSNAVAAFNAGRTEAAIALEWVEDPATRARLRDAIRDGADIFHFGGHGRFDPATQEGVLFIEGRGDADLFGSDELALLLRDAGVQLAVLGACETSRGDRRRHWSGVAQALSRQAVPAVIGNQFEIRDDLAAMLAYELYAYVLSGHSVDEALARARIALATEANLETRDWGVPTLHMRDAAGVLFPLPDEPGTAAPFAAVQQHVGTVAGRVTGARVGQLHRGELEIEQIIGLVAAGGEVVGLEGAAIGAPAPAGQPPPAREEAGSPGAVVRVDQRAAAVEGRLVGFAGSTVHGDVYVNQLGVQVYLLTAESRSRVAVVGDARDRPPYPGPVPFSYDDRHLFFGRGELVDELRRAVAASGIVVVSGPPSSGKTSLLNAGLTPELAALGTMTARIDDYYDPTAALRTAFTEATRQMDVDLGAPASLLQVVEAVTGGGAHGSLVLVLDQFERVANLPALQRQRTGREIAEVLAAAGPHVTVVVSLRDTDALDQLAEFKAAAPALLDRVITVDYLTPAEAVEAIRRPALWHGGISFSPESLIGDIVSDLDRASATAPGRIAPRNLQIVCRRLFEQARSAADRGDFPTITPENNPGVAQTLARDFERWLETRFGDRREVALRILRMLAMPPPDAWRSLDALEAAASLEEVRDVVDEMVGDGVLSRRRTDPYQYSFSSPAVREAAVRLAGLDEQQRVPQVLDNLWFGWLANERLADAGELRYLAAAQDVLAGMEGPKAALLLRSAVAAGEDVTPWLAVLRRDPGDVAKLEASPAPPPRSSLYTGLFDFVAVPDDGPGQGAVSAAAVLTSHPHQRDAAALALTVLEHYPDRIRHALRLIPGKRARRRKRAELWSGLLEAGIDDRPEFPGGDRRAIWRHRFARRFRARVGAIAGTALALGLGGGLGYGVFRWIGSNWTTIPWGTELAVNFFWAFLLAGALGLAVAAAAGALIAPAWPKTVLSGGIAFGVAHLGVTLANGQSPWDLPWASGLAFAVGLVLAAAAADVFRRGVAASAVAVLAAGVVAGLSHRLIVDFGAGREAMQLVRNASFYAAQLPQVSAGLATRSFAWFEWVSVADAALAGAFLAAGMRTALWLRARTVSQGD